MINGNVSSEFISLWFASVETKIVKWLGQMFGIFCRLVAEWRQIVFVYDILGNMVIATSVDARGDSSHRKRRVLRRW